MILESVIQKQAGLESLHSNVKKNYRQLFENSIERCLPQAINLYSCDVNEYSQDTSKGALYASNLLSAAVQSSYKEIVSCLEAHVEATKVVVKKTDGKQNPQYLCTVRCGEKFQISVH